MGIYPADLATTFSQTSIQNDYIGWANFSFSESNDVSGFKILPGSLSFLKFCGSEVGAEVVDLTELSLSDNVNINLLEDKDNGVNKERENGNPSNIVKRGIERVLPEIW